MTLAETSRVHDMKDGCRDGDGGAEANRCSSPEVQQHRNVASQRTGEHGVQRGHHARGRR